MSRDPLPARAPQLKPFMVVTSIAVACSADQSVEEVCVKTAADHWIVGRKCGERPRPRGLSSCRPNALCAASWCHKAASHLFIRHHRLCPLHPAALFDSGR